MNQDIPILRRLGMALMTACVPLLVMAFVLTIQGAQWDDYAPSMGDEIMYWHQAATWARVGLDSGYYSIDSVPARAAHYFCWGLGPVLFYGTFAQIFGWSLSSILYINAIFFFLSIVIFVLLARLDRRRCLWLALMLAVYPAILVYLPSSMIEPIHLGGALVVAGGLYRLHAGERQWWLIFVTGLALLLLCFVKITWVPIFWPFFYYLPIRRSTAASEQSSDALSPQRQNIWVAMILTGIVGFTINIFYTLTSAPYPYDIALAFGELKTDPMMAFWRYVGLMASNVVSIFNPSHLASNSTRVAVIGLMIWAVPQRRRARRRADREAVTLILYIVAAVLGLSLFVYVTEGHRGFRLFAPYVLLVFGLALAWDRMSVVRGLAALFVITLPMVLLSPELNHQDDFDPTRVADIAAHQQEFKAAGIVYREGVDPWCNAFAHSISYLSEYADQDRLLAVEPGLGMTIMWLKPDQATPARYVMLDDLSYQVYPDTASLAPLLPVNHGMIYLNNASDCS